jgi:hypothetical protein
MGKHKDLTLCEMSSTKNSKNYSRGPQFLFDSQPKRALMRRHWGSQPMGRPSDCHMTGRQGAVLSNFGEVSASSHHSAHRATLGAPCLCMVPPRTFTQATLLGGYVQWHMWSILPCKEVINSQNWKEYGRQGYCGQEVPKQGDRGVGDWFPVGYRNRSPSTHTGA